MKKMTYILIAVSTLFLGMIAVSWAQMTAPQPGATTTQTTTQPVAAAPMTAPAAPQAPAAPVAAVQTPVAPQVTAPQVNAPAVPAVAPAKPAPAAPAALSASSAGIGNVPPPAKAGAPEDLKQAINTGEFLKKLTFPLKEEQMVEFARAAIKVGKINSKWDVQIASTETDQMAIEYNNMAVEEIAHALKNIPGLTLDQYNELTRMTATDKEFNSIYLAYKQLVSEGAFGEVPKAGAIKTTQSNAPAQSSAAKYGTSVSPIMPTTSKDGNVSNNGAALPDATKPAASAATPAATTPAAP